MNITMTSWAKPASIQKLAKVTTKNMKIKTDVEAMFTISVFFEFGKAEAEALKKNWKQLAKLKNEYGASCMVSGDYTDLTVTIDVDLWKDHGSLHDIVANYQQKFSCVVQVAIATAMPGGAK